MTMTLITTLCPLPQEHDQDMGLGSPEPGRTQQTGGVCGDKEEHGQAGAWSSVDEAVEPGMSDVGKTRKEETQCSGTWLGVRTVAAVGSRAGLFAVPGESLQLQICAGRRAPFLHTQKDELVLAGAHYSCMCALKAALKESPVPSQKHAATALSNKKGVKFWQCLWKKAH